MQNAARRVAHRYLQANKDRRASSPEQWELAGKVLDDGFRGPPLKDLAIAWKDLEKSFAEAQKRSANLRRVGVGRTEDHNLILSYILPELRALAGTASVIADQFERKFK